MRVLRVTATGTAHRRARKKLRTVVVSSTAPLRFVRDPEFVRQWLGSVQGNLGGKGVAPADIEWEARFDTTGPGEPPVPVVHVTSRPHVVG